MAQGIHPFVVTIALVLPFEHGLQVKYPEEDSWRLYPNPVLHPHLPWEHLRATMLPAMSVPLATCIAWAYSMLLYLRRGLNPNTLSPKVILVASILTEDRRGQS